MYRPLIFSLLRQLCFSVPNARSMLSSDPSLSVTERTAASRAQERTHTVFCHTRPVLQKGMYCVITTNQNQNTCPHNKLACSNLTNTVGPPKRTKDICPAGWSHTALFTHFSAMRLTRYPCAASPTSCAASRYSSSACRNIPCPRRRDGRTCFKCSIIPYGHFGIIGHLDKWYSRDSISLRKLVTFS